MLIAGVLVIFLIGGIAAVISSGYVGPKGW